MDAKQTTSAEADRSIRAVLAEQISDLRPRLCLAGIRPSKRIHYTKSKYIQKFTLYFRFVSPHVFHKAITRKKVSPVEVVFLIYPHASTPVTPSRIESAPTPRKSHSRKIVRDFFISPSSRHPPTHSIHNSSCPIYTRVRGSTRLTVVTSRPLRKVLPPLRNTAVHKYGWRESQQWNRNDTSSTEQ